MGIDEMGTYHTGLCVSAASREKEGLLLTYIDSEHTAWLVMHSSYTNRRGVKKSLRMINTPSAQLGLSKNLSRLLRSVSSHFTTSSPRVVNVHTPATLSKRLFALSSPTLHCVLVLKVACGAKMLLIVCTRRAVALQSKLNRHLLAVTEALHTSCDQPQRAGDGRTIHI